MRILHVIPTIDRRAGGPVVATGLAAAQRRAGLDVGALVVHGSGHDLAPAREMEAAGVRVSLVGPVDGRGAEAKALAGPLREAVASADVVHIHALWEVVQHHAAREALRAGVPYGFTPHGMLDSWSLAQRRLKKRIYLALRLGRYLRRAAAFHATSELEREEIAALRLGPRVVVEPLGVEMREFESLPPRGEFRAAHPEIGDRRLVVYLGRIHPGKGLEYLIPALARPGAENVFLAAVGPDSRGHLERMRGIAAELGVADRVMFTGMMRGHERLKPLVDADLFALPSDHENFGMAVIEALAAGAPVLISDRVNICREIRKAGVGLVVDRDPAKIAQAAGEFLADPAARQNAAARARPFALGRYDWDVIGPRWVDHYRAMVSPAPGR
jgi:glycosyltransferase involved in cell wall biosynthesis